MNVNQNTYFKDFLSRFYRSMDNIYNLYIGYIGVKVQFIKAYLNAVLF